MATSTAATPILPRPQEPPPLQPTMATSTATPIPPREPPSLLPTMATSTSTPILPRSIPPEPPPLLPTMATSTATPILPRRIPPEPPPLQDKGTHSLLISISQNLSSPYLKTSHPPVLKQHQHLFATFHKRKKTELLSTVVGLPQNANGIVLLQNLCQVPNSPA